MSGRRGPAKAWLLGLPALAGLAVLLAPDSASSGSGDQLTGYEKIVRDVYARRGILTISRNPGEPVVKANPDELTRNKTLRDYYELSYLRRDVEQNDPRLWDVEGRLIGLAPGAHRSPSPFAPGAWHGDILLASNEVRLMLKAVSGTGDQAAILLDPGASLQSVRRPLTVQLGGVELPARPASYLRLVQPNSTRATAEVRVVAGHVWIESLADGVTVDAAPIEPGQGKMIENGASLTLEDPAGGPPTRMILVRASSSTISKWNGVGVRYRDDSYGDLAEAIEAAMDSATYRCGADCPFARKPVKLTLDREVDAAAQAALDSVAATDRWPAAVSVMDVRTGDLLALASHAPAGSALRRTEWDRTPINYNFQPLPVGSAAKPLITAAIIANDPSLAGLEVRTEAKETPDGRSAPQVLGFDMAPTLGVVDGIPSGTWVDLPTYLQHSSNYYAAAMMILGIDRTQGRGTPSLGSYRFKGGSAQGLVPPLKMERQGSVYWLDAFPSWKRTLRRLFGIGSRRLRGAADTTVWRNLPGGMGRVEDPASAELFAGFEPLSPVRQDWALDQASSFTLRESYIPVILGGAAYPWTTIGLAQGYARIVTGSQVGARLVAADGDLPQRGAGLSTTNRRVLCEGLARVTETGTGSREPGLIRTLASLRSAAPGSTIGFFSKTGTPEIDRLTAAQERLADLEDQLLAEGRIRFVGGKLTVEAARGGPIVPTEQVSQDLALRSLQRQGVDPVVARRAAARMVAFNTGSRNAYLTLLGAPKRVPRPAPSQQDFGHAYVLVITVHKGASVDLHDCTQTPTAAFAVAINVQEEEDRFAALKVAARLLERGALRDRILSAARLSNRSTHP